MHKICCIHHQTTKKNKNCIPLPKFEKKKTVTVFTRARFCFFLQYDSHLETSKITFEKDRMMEIVGYTVCVVSLFTCCFVVCEDYFVPSLCWLGNRLGLSHDMQGALLLAIGSSTPELFTSLISIMIYNDITLSPGPSTIVGSSMYNLSVITGISCLFINNNNGNNSDSGISINIYAVYRDLFCFIISVIALHIFYDHISPNEISGFEGLALVSLWVIYIFILLTFSDKINSKQVKQETQEVKQKVEPNSSENNVIDIVQIMHENDKRRGIIRDENKRYRVNLKQFKSVVHNIIDIIFKVFNNFQLKPIRWLLKRIFPDIKHITQSRDKYDKSSKTSNSNNSSKPKDTNDSSNSSNESSDLYDKYDKYDKSSKASKSSMSSSSLIQIIVDNIQSNTTTNDVKSKSDTTTNHDRDTNRTESVLHGILIFCLSILYLGIITYLLLTVVSLIGQYYSLSLNNMGMTLIAIGSSLPDTISSIVLARSNKFDIILSNCFSANIFNIGFVLGTTFTLLILFETDKDYIIQIDSSNSQGLMMIQIITCFLFAILIHLSNIKLCYWHGFVLLAMYALFIYLFVYLN